MPDDRRASFPPAREALDEDPGDEMTQSARRTELSRERTELANERTFASWIRTGLAAIAAGFVIAKLSEDFEPRWAAVAVGVALIVTGAGMEIAGLWRYAVARQVLRSHLGWLWVLGALTSVAILSALGGAALVIFGSPAAPGP